MPKTNHAGVVIDIPDEAKQLAILTLPDGAEIKTGRKKFGTADEFRLYLERQAQTLRAESDAVKAAETRSRVAKRARDESAAAITNLKAESFEDPEEFAEMTARKARQLMMDTEEMRHADHDNKMSTSQLADHQADLERNDK